MRYILPVLFLLSCSNKHGSNSLDQSLPDITFENLITAHISNSVEDYLKGRYTWTFEFDEPSLTIYYFPIKIGEFVGELCYNRTTNSFSFITGNWSGRIKTKLGDELKQYDKQADYSTYIEFIDSLAKQHRTVLRKELEPGATHEVAFAPDQNTSYLIYYKQNQVHMIISTLLSPGAH